MNSDHHHRHRHRRRHHYYMGDCYWGIAFMGSLLGDRYWAIAFEGSLFGDQYWGLFIYFIDLFFILENLNTFIHKFSIKTV
jgi:hypothetical protein